MSKFKKLVADLEAKNKTVSDEMSVTKAPNQNAPKKDEKLSNKTLVKSKEVAAILDMAFMLKTTKQSKGLQLNDREKAMFADAISEKAATVITDVESLIPSGFSGSFVQDMYAMTNLHDIFPMEQISTFGMTDTIGDFGMVAEVVSELGTPTDTNDETIDFEYRGGKLMAKTYISYEALADATIDMLANKRTGLMRAMAVAVETATLNGQSGDAGITGTDARTLFRGLRKYGTTKASIDFGGAALTEATLKTKILEMQEAGGLYTAWEEVDAGNVVIIAPTKFYNSVLGFDAFTDASKSGVASTLVSGRKVSTLFNIPIVTNRFFPALVNAAGIVSATAGDNLFQSIIMVNTKTFKVYNISNSALMEADKNIETQKHVLTASNRVGAGSSFDCKSSAPTTIDVNYKNIIAGVNISI